MTAYTNEEILRTLRVAVVRDHRRRRRRYRTVAAALAILALSTAAVASTRQWWTDAAPATNQDVVDWQLAPERLPDGSSEQPADPKLARTVAHTEGATLVAAPSEGGGYCLLPQLDRQLGASAGETALGFGCVPATGDGQGGGSAFGTLMAADGWFVYGRITDTEATAIDLSDAAGQPLRVDLAANGFFIAPLPNETWARLDDRVDEITILGDDGHVLRHACVPFSPAPYSLVEGPRGGGGLADGQGDERCPHSGQFVQAPPQPLSARLAPPLVGTDMITGKRVSLDDFAGQPVAIGFWKSPSADSDTPEGVLPEELEVLYLLAGFADAHPGIGVVAVHVGGEVNAQLRAQLPLGYAQVADVDGRIADAYSVDEWRTILFLDEGHRLRSRIVGEPTDPEFMRGLRMATG
jgi:hypothetical protein